jgi:hypothetical protein
VVRTGRLGPPSTAAAIQAKSQPPRVPLARFGDPWEKWSVESSEPLSDLDSAKFRSLWTADRIYPDEIFTRLMALHASSFEILRTATRQTSIGIPTIRDPRTFGGLWTWGQASHRSQSALSRPALSTLLRQGREANGIRATANFWRCPQLADDALRGRPRWRRRTPMPEPALRRLLGV